MTRTRVPTPAGAKHLAARHRMEYGVALGLDLLGAGAALLISTRTWQVVTTPRPSPLPPDMLSVTGRTVDAAATALALVALAGVVAVLATRGPVRRVIGALLALAGVGLIWRAVQSTAAIGSSRARELVNSTHRTVTTDPGVVSSVAVHLVWPILSIACGVLVAVSGATVASRGHLWRAMSNRYERRVSLDLDPETRDARAAATLWNALDRGDDPTTPGSTGGTAIGLGDAATRADPPQPGRP